MKRLLTLCLLFMAVALCAQPADRYALDMSRIAADARSDSRYGALLDRFRACDTLLTTDELRTIYYGFAARDEYLGDVNPAQCRVNELIEQGREREALALAVIAQQKYPVSLRLLYHIILLGENRFSEEIVATYRWMYFSLMKTIRESGDGSREYPFRIIAIADEYDFLLRFLGTDKIIGQSQIRNGNDPVLDCIDFQPVHHDIFHGGRACFDITLLDDYLHKQLSDEKN